MHTWQILRMAWTAVVVIYCVLGVVAEARLHGEAKRRSREIFVGFAVLYVIREVVGRLVGGLAFQFLVVAVGVAAGIAAIVVAKMLISQPCGDEDVAVAAKERIQSLRLN